MRRVGWFLIVGRWRGAPVRIHLLAPLFAVLMRGNATTPGTVVGLLAVVLLHEVGHALVINRVGARVERIDLLPWGGECAHSGASSEFHDSLIAWGGVLAQFAVMVPAQLLLTVFPPQSQFEGDVMWSLTFGSFCLAVFNLIPFPPLDGAKAWKMIVLGPRWLSKRWRKRRHLRVVEAPPPRKDYLN